MRWIEILNPLVSLIHCLNLTRKFSTLHNHHKNIMHKKRPHHRPPHHHRVFQTPPKKKHRVAFCDRTFHEVLWPYSPPQSLQESDPQMAPETAVADKMPAKWWNSYPSKKLTKCPLKQGGVILKGNFIFQPSIFRQMMEFLNTFEARFDSIYPHLEHLFASKWMALILRGGGCAPV